MIYLIPILILLATNSFASSASQQLDGNQAVDLYCEGKDWASERSKHILVSLDRAKHIVSITDEVSDTPRVLELIETTTMYKARGDHLAGYIDIEQEKIPYTTINDTVCEAGYQCNAYIVHSVNFKLNRQSGKFEYLMVKELREEGSNTLIKKLNEWGMFRDSRCTSIRQKY